MKLLGIAGWSGSGKTTLIAGLLPRLSESGIRVSTIKHAHHGFDVDQPGKDSYEHRKAGASEVLVSSSRRWVLMHENRGEPEPSLTDLVSRLSAVDLVLVEGFKREAIDKLEVYRQGLGKPMLQHEDPRIVAVASDTSLADVPVPVLSLAAVDEIAAFIAAHCGFAEQTRYAAAQGL